jgi:catechol 2,3-dioxygenase-like lactoylglutathione lyase family enzyme
VSRQHLQQAALAGALLGALALPAGAAERDWIATWQASPQPLWAADFPFPTQTPFNLWQQTVRQVARVSLGGETVRVELSNAYGHTPLQIGAAHLALAGDGAAILPGSDRELRFGGQRAVTIPPGAPVLSDPVALTVPDLARTSRVLTDAMNMRRVRDYALDAAHHAHVFAMGEGGPAAELHVIERPDLAPARQGAGGVHHVAFRAPDEAQYHAWTQRLTELGIQNSGEIDRYYFRSLYFREPNGVLFEIATDGPGFATDEPADKLGERLALPPFLEPKRAAIEAKLKPL